MPPDSLSQQLSVSYDPSAWVTQHPVITIWLAAFCLWVSISLIIHMWFVHRRASAIKKLLWSFALLIPLFGWLSYCGCFTQLDSINTPCPHEHEPVGSGGGSFDAGGHF